MEILIIHKVIEALDIRMYDTHLYTATELEKKIQFLHDNEIFTRKILVILTVLCTVLHVVLVPGEIIDKIPLHPR